jgi:DNA-binding MarR family transcriptional regulator
MHRNPDFSARDIERRLGISKFQIARLLSHLEDGGCIRRSPSATDQRFNTIELTPLGEELLQRSEALDATVSERLLEALQPHERSTFISFMQRLATGLGARPQRLQHGEHPLFLEQRRLVEATGTITANYMGTGYPIVAVHMFLDLSRHDSMTFKALERGLPFEATMISRLTSKFVTRGFIVKQPNPEDARSIVLRLTERGKKHFKERIQDPLDAKHTVALKGFEESELTVFMSMLTRIADLDLTNYVSTAAATRLCAKEPELHLARRFLVERLVAEQRHGQLSASLLPKDSFCTAYYREGTIVALLEARFERRRWVAKHLVYDDEGLAILSDFIRQSAQLLRTRAGVDRFSIPQDLITPAVADLLALKPATRGWYEAGGLGG